MGRQGNGDDRRGNCEDTGEDDASNFMKDRQRTL